ncbi:MAG TPA: polysaccharide deacetylase family protein [Pseudomonadales bacterium]
MTKPPLRHLLPLLVSILAPLAAAQDASPASAVILQYHHVSANTPRVTSVNLDEFRAHMDYLRDNGFTVLPLEDIVTALRNGDSLPDRSAAITFDDGYRNNYDAAYSLLREYGWPFTLFISSDLVGSNDALYLSWDQIREMAGNGATIANHGITHLYLLEREKEEDDDAWLKRVEHEIVTAEEKIEKETGQGHKLFAYPYGEYDRTIQDLVARLGFTGIGQHSGPVNASSDFTALPRFPFSGVYASMDTFAVKVQSLAFDVQLVEPETPVTDEQMPAAVLDFDGDYRLGALTCFNNDLPMDISVVDEEEQQYRIEPLEPSTARRFRYNCTAPAGNGRFYWVSVPWVNPALDDY